MTPRTLTRTILSMDLAEALASEAVRVSLAMGRNTVVAICDESGILKAFRRPDFTNFGCVDFALLKAYTAARFNTATHVHWSYWEGEPRTQIGMSALAGATIEGGGVPIRIKGTLVGGIGVSGAQHWKEDVEIAAKAFAKFDIDPPTDTYEAPVPMGKRPTRVHR